MKKKSSPLHILVILGLIFGSAPQALGSGPPASPSVEEEFEQAITSYRREEYFPALTILLRLEEEGNAHSLQPDILFMQGQAWRALLKWTEAAQAFSRAANTHPLLSDYALFFLAEAWQKAGEGEKGLDALHRLTALHPKSLLIPQAQLKMAELFFQSGDSLRAAEVCEKLLKGDRGKEIFAQARFVLAQARESLEQWPEAIKTYQELWWKHPLDPEAKKAKARWKALEREKGTAAPPIAPELLLQRALQFYQGKMYEACLREMSRIEGFPLQTYPPLYAGQLWVDDLYFHRGMSYFRLRQYGKAREAFELIVRRSRNDAMAEKSLFWMFQALIRQDRKEEALNTHSLFQATYPRSGYSAQALYLRAAVYEDMGKIPRAVSLYREVAEQFPQSPIRFPALWKAGWLLYRAQDLPGAIQTWDRLRGMDSNSRWTEKALYWRGRGLEKMGLLREAGESFERLLKNFPTSYYSQLVSTRGKFPLLAPDPFATLQDKAPPPFLELKATSPGNKVLHLEKGGLLTRLALLPLAVGELQAAEEEGLNVDEMWMEISRLFREAEEYYRSNLLVRRKFTFRPLAVRSSEKEKALYRLAYPLGNLPLIQRYARLRNLDPALLCALILEESRFHSQAISAAGARGLMQVLPSTGRQIARELKVHPFSEEQLFDPGLNVRFGSWYFFKQLEEFGGKIPLALAAYNAGPHMVRRWIAKANTLAEDEFVESIPFAETRNYVIRVISSAQVYRTLYRPPEEPVQP